MDRQVPVTTRRAFIAAGGAALAASALGVPALAGGARTAQAGLRRSQFAGHVGKTFTLTAPSGASMRARLDEITDHGEGRHVALRGSDQAFVLTFRAAEGTPALAQDVMEVQRPGFGSRDLLLAPSSTGRNGLLYTAVIDSRQLPEEAP